jgi:hypothetical protein
MPSNEQYKFMCFPFGAVANMNTNCYSAHCIPVIDHGYLARIPTHVSNHKHTEYDMTKSIEVFVQLFLVNFRSAKACLSLSQASNFFRKEVMHDESIHLKIPFFPNVLNLLSLICSIRSPVSYLLAQEYTKCVWCHTVALLVPT